MAKGLRIDFNIDSSHSQTDFPQFIYTGTTIDAITGTCICASGMTINNSFTGQTCELSGLDDALNSVYVKITCDGCDDQIQLLSYIEPTPTVTPTPDTSNTPTPTQTPTTTETPTVTPTVTPTPDTSNTPTPTQTVTPTITSTQTVTPTITSTQTVTPTPTPECLDCRNWEYVGATIPIEGDTIHYYRCSDGVPQTIVLSNGDPTGQFCNCNGLGNPYSDNGTILTEIGICGEPPTPTPTPTLTPTPENYANWYFSRGDGTSCTGSHFEIFKNGNPVPVVSYTNSTGSTSGSISVAVGDVLVISVDTGNQSSPTGCSNAYVKYDSQQFLDDSPGGFTNAEITVTVTQNDISYGIIICGTLGGGVCPS